MPGLARFTHASMVKSWRCKLAGSPTTTASPFPSSTNPCPTLPGPSIASPVRVPLFPSAESLALLCACHQLTMPAGAGVQGGCGRTVSTALELSTAPAKLLTETEYAPELLL